MKVRNIKSCVALLLASLSLNAGGRELEGSTPPISKHDWRATDRHNYLKSRVSQLLPSFGLSRPGSEFFQAWRENIIADRPKEYTSIAQRHSFYDVFAHYVSNPQTDAPKALRCVRFFHAAASVTNEFGLGTIDVKRVEQTLAEAIGAIPAITPGGATLLRETNEVLFRTNFGVIKSLLVDWKEPRSPSGSASTIAISPLQFDIEMVRLEQSLVKEKLENFFRSAKPEEISSLKKFFSGHPALDRSMAFSYYMVAGPAAVEVARRANLVSSWLPQVLRTNWDFFNEAHRVALGQAMVFRAHGLGKDEYIKFKQTGILPLSRCGGLPITQDPPRLPKETQAGSAALIATALGRDRTGLNFALASAAVDLLSADSNSSTELARQLDLLVSLAKRRTDSSSATELARLLLSSEAQELGLSRHSGAVISNISGQRQTAFDIQLSASQFQEQRISVALSHDESGLLWKLLTELTGLDRSTKPADVEWSSPAIEQREVEQVKRAIAILTLPPDQQEAKIREALLERLDSARQAALLELELAQKFVEEGWNKGIKAEEAWQSIKTLNTTGDLDAGLSALDAVAIVTGDERVVELARNIRTATNIYKSAAQMVSIVSIGGLAGIGSFSAVEGVLGSLGGGVTGGSDEEIKATLQRMFEFLRIEFENVNLKLDKIIELIEDQRRTLTEIQYSLELLNGAATRIEGRLDEVIREIQSTGFDVINVISQGNIAECRGKASAQGGMSEIKLLEYSGCISQFITFLESAYTALVAKCPVDGSGLTKEIARTLVTSDAVAASRFACVVAREALYSQGRTEFDTPPVIDAMAPWPWLADGSLFLERFRLQRPDLWARIGRDSEERLERLHARLSRSNEMLSSVAGTSGALRQRYLESTYTTRFESQLGRVAAAIETTQSKRVDAGYKHYIDRLIDFEKSTNAPRAEWFPDTWAGLGYKVPPCKQSDANKPYLYTQLGSEIAAAAALRRLRTGWWTGRGSDQEQDLYTPLLCVTLIEFKYTQSPSGLSVAVNSTIEINLQRSPDDILFSQRVNITDESYASKSQAVCGGRYPNFSREYDSCLSSAYYREKGRALLVTAIGSFAARSDVQATIRAELEKEVRLRRDRDPEFARRYDRYLIASTQKILAELGSLATLPEQVDLLSGYELNYSLMRGYLILLLPNVWIGSDRTRELFDPQSLRSWATVKGLENWSSGKFPLQFCGITMLPVGPAIIRASALKTACKELWEKASIGALQFMNNEIVPHPSLISTLGLARNLKP
jgi:hypothetical protein